MHGRTGRKALPVAAVVGTVLSAVNQGSVIAGGLATASTWIRVGVNYAVPFVVASVGYLAGRRVRPDGTDWQRYLAGYHADRPGITELLLAPAVDRRLGQPYQWLVEPLRGTPGPILDLACGSAPTRPLLAEAWWLGADASAGELAAASGAGRGPLVRARADALPVADRAVAAVCAAMCFPVLTRLDAVLAELKRVLRPGGVLVALVPSRLGLDPRGWVGWRRVMRRLGIRSVRWPNPQTLDGLAGIYVRTASSSTPTSVAYAGGRSAVRPRRRRWPTGCTCPTSTRSGWRPPSARRRPGHAPAVGCRFRCGAWSPM
jgi:SAM-dependent methyltransferase